MTRALYLIAIVLFVYLARPDRAPAAIVIVVDTTADGVDNSCSDDDCTLSEAFQVANSDGVDSVITVPNLGDPAPDIFSPASFLQITENHDWEINGAGAATTIVDMLDITTGLYIACGAACDVSISGLTVRNGRVDVGSGGSFAGVGLNNAAGNVTLTNVVISDHEAVGSGQATITGVGIANSGTLTLNNSTISGNFSNSPVARVGAGIYNSGTITMAGSTVSNNSFGLDTVALGGAVLPTTVRLTSPTARSAGTPQLGPGVASGTSAGTPPLRPALSLTTSGTQRPSTTVAPSSS